MNEIRIDGLTVAQVRLLDKMWSIDREDEYLSWFEELQPEIQHQVELLQRLLIMATIDQQELDCTAARNYLQKFRL